MISPRFCMVLISVPSSEEAHRIARILVEERLAACCTMLGGTRSFYQWEGRLEEAEEHLLLCKTDRDHFSALESRIRLEHSYTIPEIIAMPITEGSAPYLAWLESGLKDHSG